MQYENLPKIELPPGTSIQLGCINGFGCKLQEMERRYKSKIARLEEHLKAVAKGKREYMQFCEMLIEENKKLKRDSA